MNAWTFSWISSAGSTISSRFQQDTTGGSHVGEFIQACLTVASQYSRRELLASRFTGRHNTDRPTLDTIAELELLRYRGARAGRCVQAACVNQRTPEVSCLDSQRIEVVTTAIHKDTRSHRCAGPRSRVLVYLKRHELDKSIKVGRINIKLIHNKFTLVADCIVTNGFSFFVVIETSHGLIGATRSGYRCIEKARSAKNALKTLTNHRDICFFYKRCYRVRRNYCHHTRKWSL